MLSWRWFNNERVKGIEPSYAAWEAAVLPLNYTRVEFGLWIGGLRLASRDHCHEMTSSFELAELFAPLPPSGPFFPSDQAMTPWRMLALPAPVSGV